MAKVTITIEDLPSQGDGKSYVKFGLDSDPPLPKGVDYNDPKQVTLAQFVANYGASVMMDALRTNFQGGKPIPVPKRGKQH